MKSHFLTLTLLMGGLLLTPAAMAQQYGMDTSYNDNIAQQQQNQQNQQNQKPQPLVQGFAATGTQAYTTSANAWQDMTYIQGQQSGVQIPGTLQAPLQASPFGTVSTYLGNTGQWLKGVSAPLGTSLPQTQNGLNAINGGYTGEACGMAGTGGFPGMQGGSLSAPSTSMYSKKGVSLPPTSTTTIDLNITQ